MKIKNLFKRKKKTVLYDMNNNPIIPIRSKKDVKIKHKFQRPSIFTETETDELLKRVKTSPEGKLSPP